MNSDTRVAICCYAGDAHYVSEMMAVHRAHECPITILSPDDSRAEIPGVDCRFGGKRAYIGQDCLDRMREHLKILLTYPENYFLIHDSDSICLSPELPAYLYAEDVLWSNQVINNLPEQQPGFAPDIPHIAFQPPWFMSRKILKRLIEVSEGNTVCNQYLPFIDYWMVEMAVRNDIPWRPLPTALSAALSVSLTDLDNAVDWVHTGMLIFVHSVKGARVARPLMTAYEYRGRPMPGSPAPRRHRSQLPYMSNIVGPKA